MIKISKFSQSLSHSFMRRMGSAGRESARPTRLPQLQLPLVSNDYYLHGSEAWRQRQLLRPLPPSL